jgi:hypothetical protein
VTTAQDIVTQSFKKAGLLGLGQTMDGGDFADGLSDLGDMLALWNEKRWLVWHLIDFALLASGQIVPYTVGPGGNFNMSPRPTRIEAAYVRQMPNTVTPVDTPLRVVQSYEDWSRIAVKQLISYPKYIFLDTAFPIGQLHLYPWPNAGIYEIHIVVKDVFPVTLTNTTSFANYPPMTIPAMKFNLARWMRQAYGKGLRADPELNAMANDALETMRNSQVQVPELNMPRLLIAVPNLYNIFADTY